MKKNKIKKEKNINYKLAAKILIALMIISIIGIMLIITFAIIQKLPTFSLIFFTILPIFLLLIIFFLSRNMYNDIIEFERRYKKRNQELDKKIMDKEEKARKRRLAREEDII